MTTVSTELTDAECDAFRALPLDFNGMVRAIYAAGAARSADTSGARWRPIETAPKDGTEILLTNGTIVSSGNWVDMPGGIEEIRDIDGRWIDQIESEDNIGWIDWSGGMNPDPTLWMPLPEPPPAAPGGPAGARRPDENSPSGPSDRALNLQPEAVDHDRGAR